MKTPDQSQGEMLPFSRGISTHEIPSHGLKDRIAFTKKQCLEIANILGIEDVSRFEFDYELKQTGQGRYRLTGDLTAHVTQQCVITLDPVESQIDEKLEIDLWPPADVEEAERSAEEEGRSVLLDGPEPLLGDQIDIGQLAYEHLAASLDPYPRKQNAKFEGAFEDEQRDSDDTVRPFAGLRDMLRERGSKSDEA